MSSHSSFQDDPAKLKVRRRGMRCSVTKRLKQLADLLERSEIEKVEHQLEKVTAAILRAKELDERYWNLLTDIELEGDHSASEELYAQWEDEIIAKRSEYRQLIASNIPVNEPINLLEKTCPITVIPQNIPNEGRIRDQEHLQLPTIDLRKFDGNPVQWPEFWNGFISTIHERSHIDDFAKHHYLRRSLTGKAARLLEGIPISQDTYREAIEMLKTRFGRPKLIINALFTIIINAEAVHDSSDNLVRFSSDIQSAVRNLRVMKVADHEHKWSTIAIIQQKLNGKLREKWRAKTLANDDPSVEMILAFLQEEAILRDDPLSGDTRRIAPSSSTSVLLIDEKKRFSTSNDSRKRFGAKQCFICEAIGHWASDCKLPHGEKMKIVERKNLCLNCLRKGHRASSCRSSQRCRKCHQLHHTSLCVGVECHQLSIHDNAPSTSAYCASQSLNAEVLRNMCVVETKRGVKLNVLFDSGSNKSFISEHASRISFGREVERTEVSIQSFGGGMMKQSNAPVVEIKLKARRKTGDSYTLRATVIPEIGDIDMISNKLHNRLSQNHISIPQFKRRDIDILIGMDYYWDIIDPVGTERIENSGLCISSTIFGPVISGIMSSQPNKSVPQCTAMNLLFDNNVNTESSTKAMLKICFDDEQPIAKGDFDKKLKIARSDERIQVFLPFKDERRPGNNECVVRRRMEKGLHRTSQEARDFMDEEIIRLQREGIIERTTRPFHLMPYFVVSHNGKQRMVYDASFSTRTERSLNSYLDDGNMTYNCIDQILLRSRLGQYCIGADIKKAFSQISVAPEDRKFLQIAHRGTKEWKFYHFNRIPFGICCGPAIFREALQKVLNQIDKSRRNQLNKSFYMDDLLLPASDKEKGEADFRVLSSALRSYGFNWGRMRRSDEKVTTSILGMIWDEDDSYRLILPEKKETKIVTKRSLLQYVAAIYDPMGICTPSLTKGRHLIRNCWKEKMKWDEVIVEKKELNSIEAFKKELNLWRPIRISRYIGKGKIIAMHSFVDASKIAEGNVVYLVTDDGLKFFYSKSRLVSTSKTLTIQRSELNALVFGAKIAHRLRTMVTELMAVKFTLWSDSKDNIMRVQNGKTYRDQYVQNRLDILRDMNLSLKFCEGKRNPADLPSRIVSLKASQIDEWLAGPQWLLNEESWPSQDVLQTTSCVEEVYATCAVVDQTKSHWVDLYGRFSEWRKVIRIHAYVERAIASMRHMSTVLNYSAAERRIIQSLQQAYCENEITSLRQDTRLNAYSLYHNRNVRLMNDVMVMNMRRYEGESYHSLMIIPHVSFALQQIIRHIHFSNNHCGVNQTMFEFRKKYWSFRLRTTTKRVIKSCVFCRRRKIVQVQQMEGMVPDQRTTIRYPFYCTGIDYAGPFNLTDGNKAYVLLFVCATTRAVHFETTKNVNFEATYMAIRRFVARRSLPRSIISDNAAVFVECSKRLKNNSVSNMEGYSIWNNEIVWSFNPPSAPWWGGFYERMVGLLKRHLRYRNDTSPSNHDRFEATVIEIENLMNRRPLTAIRVNEEITSISPMDFLLPSHNVLWEEKALHMNLKSQNIVQRQMKKHLLETYTQELMEFHRHRHSDITELKTGDVVLLADNDDRRNWSLGIIVKTFAGRDGVVRTTKVRVIRKNKPIELIRPIQRLCLLEKGMQDVTDSAKPRN